MPIEEEEEEVCDTIYLTAIGLTPSGSSTVHIYTQTIIQQHNENRMYRTEHK